MSGEIVLNNFTWKEIGDGLDSSMAIIDSDFNLIYKNHPSTLFSRHFTKAHSKHCYSIFFGKDSPCLFCPRLNHSESLQQLNKKKYRASQRIAIEVPDKPAPRIFHYELKQFIVESDNHFFLVETLRDYTMQTEKQEEFVRNEKLIALGTVVQTVAHELGNPLAGMSLTLQSMSKEITLEDLRKKINLLNNDLQILNSIVSDIKNFTRKEGYRLLPIEIKPVISQLIDRFKDISGVDILYRWIWEVDKKIKIKGNANKLHQVFHNLIKNSMEAFTENIHEEGRSRPQLWIIAKLKNLSNEKTSSNEKEVLEIQFIDNAGGIKQGMIRRIFDPYFSTKRISGKGSGLGLFAVHKIMEEHNGSIEVESQGNYTRFILQFLLAK